MFASWNGRTATRPRSLALAAASERARDGEWWRGGETERPFFSIWRTIGPEGHARDVAIFSKRLQSKFEDDHRGEVEDDESVDNEEESRDCCLNR